jgi:putative peptidoglycan lipid II flippase
VRIAVLTLLATQAMNLAFIVPLKHAGLALAIALGACLNAGLLFRMLRKQGIYRAQPGWARFLARVLASVLLMALALGLAMGEAQWWLAAPGLQKAPALAGLVLLGAAVYGGSLLAMGVRVKDFARQAVD